jgi:hypothetical protein
LLQAEAAHVQDVVEAARGGDDNINTSLDFLELGALWCSSVQALKGVELEMEMEIVNENIK